MRWSAKPARSACRSAWLMLRSAMTCSRVRLFFFSGFLCDTTAPSLRKPPAPATHRHSVSINGKSPRRPTLPALRHGALTRLKLQMARRTSALTPLGKASTIAPLGAPPDGHPAPSPASPRRGQGLPERNPAARRPMREDTTGGPGTGASPGRWTAADWRLLALLLLLAAGLR